jgi:hypothetical protein
MAETRLGSNKDLGQFSVENGGRPVRETPQSPDRQAAIQDAPPFPRPLHFVLQLMAEMPVGMTLCPTKSPEAKFEKFLRRRSALRDFAVVRCRCSNGSCLSIAFAMVLH